MKSQMLRRIRLQSMRLVDQQRTVVRQQTAAARLTHGKIGKEQRMIGHNDIGAVPLPARPVIKTVFEERTLRTGAVAVFAAYHAPDYGIDIEVEGVARTFRNAGSKELFQSGDVQRQRGSRQQRIAFGSGKERESASAQIIAPSLGQHRLELHSEYTVEQREIATYQLFLEIDRLG